MLTRSIGFKHDERGLSGVEFALIAPILMTLLLGGYEIQRYLTIDRQLSTTAMTVAELFAQEDGPLDSGTSGMIFDTAIHTFPEASRYAPRPWHRVLGHQIYHVVFTPTQPGCTTGCSFDANMAWIWPPYDRVGKFRASCGPAPVIPDGSPPPGVPASLVGAGSMVVVDLTFDFKPSFGSTFVPSIQMVRSGYSAAQFAHPYIKFPSAPGSTFRNNIVCPGYE